MLRYLKTRRRFEIAGQPRVITRCCNQRLQLFNNDSIKLAFVEQMRITRERCRFTLLAWVIMPEHIHLLLVPCLPEFPIRVVLRDLKGSFANRVLRRWRQLDAPILDRLRDRRGKPHFWLQGGGYDRNMRKVKSLEAAIDYIHMNPVRRGLVSNPLEWKWSSARWHTGLIDGDILDLELNARGESAAVD